MFFDDFHRKKDKDLQLHSPDQSLDMEIEVTQPKRTKKAGQLTAAQQSRKWQTENLVVQHTVFVHRSQIKHAELFKGQARIFKDNHANELKFGRVSDPYGDFSPLLLTLLKEDNSQLAWDDEKNLKKQLTKQLQLKTVEILGGAEEKVASSDLQLSLCGHRMGYQHFHGWTFGPARCFRHGR